MYTVYSVKRLTYKYSTNQCHCDLYMYALKVYNVYV